MNVTSCDHGYAGKCCTLVQVTHGYVRSAGMVEVRMESVQASVRFEI